jgi:hypothetical protein
MKITPTTDGTGTIPLRASKNPVLGVFLHHCGEISSVHQPKGKRSHTRYLMCDRCGQDQAAGIAYQDEIKANTYPSIELLQAAKNAVKAGDKATITISEPVTYVEVLEVTDTKTDTLTDKAIDKPLEAIPPQAAENVVSTVKSVTEIVTPPLPVTQTDKPIEAIPPANPKRIGLAAVIGGFFGVVLALVA